MLCREAFKVKDGEQSKSQSTRGQQAWWAALGEIEEAYASGANTLRGGAGNGIAKMLVCGG